MRVPIILLVVLAVAVSCSYALVDYAQYRSTTSSLHATPIICVLVAGFSAFGAPLKLREIVVALSIAGGIVIDRAHVLAASSMMEYFNYASWQYFVPPVLASGALSLTWGRRMDAWLSPDSSSRSFIAIGSCALLCCLAVLRVAPIAVLFATIVFFMASFRPKLLVKAIAFFAGLAVLLVVVNGMEVRAGTNASPLFAGLAVMVVLSAAIVFAENVDRVVARAPHRDNGLTHKVWRR